jgi:hypothetical protein
VFLLDGVEKQQCKLLELVEIIKTKKIKFEVTKETA